MLRLTPKSARRSTQRSPQEKKTGHGQYLTNMSGLNAGSAARICFGKGPAGRAKDRQRKINGYATRADSKGSQRIPWKKLLQNLSGGGNIEMLELITQFGGWAGTTIVIVALFVRIEHRLTKVETLVTVIAGKAGVCQPNLEVNT